MKGQSAIITGASSGLGVIFAEALAESGVNIIIAARRYEKLIKVAEDLSSKYEVIVIPVKTDVSQEEQVINMVNIAVEKLGSLEILVNNAGITSECPSTDMSIEEWKKVININLTGLFLCARTIAREMIKKKYGKIINIASVYGAVGEIFPVAHYYASKGGVINLTRALAIEWAPYKINVNAIAPGYLRARASQASNYVTGQTIFVDGGWTAL